MREEKDDTSGGLEDEPEVRPSEEPDRATGQDLATGQDRSETSQPDLNAPSPASRLTTLLDTMRELVMRAEGLAELHAEADSLPTAASDEAVPPMKTLPMPLLPEGDLYVCLDDGVLVGASALLQGDRKGAPYLPLADAAAQCHSALAIADVALQSKIDDARSVAEAAASASAEWANWIGQAQQNADLGFDALLRAVEVQRAAAHLSLQQQRTEAEESATRAAAAARAAYRAAALQHRHLAGYAQTAANAPAAAVVAGWADLRATFASLAAQAGGDAGTATTAASTTATTLASDVDAGLAASVTAEAVSYALADLGGITPSLMLPLAPLPANLPALCVAPPVASFDAAGQLATMAASFPSSPSSPATADESSMATLLKAQREALERSQKALGEQRAATAMLQQQLEESQASAADCVS